MKLAVNPFGHDKRFDIGTEAFQEIISNFSAASIA